MKGIVVLLAVLAALPVTQSYHIAQTYELGGEGSWDYVVRPRHVQVARPHSFVLMVVKK